MKLRPYQTKMVADIDEAWLRGAQNVLGRLATGGGKTPVLGEIVSQQAAGSCVIAHRSELVSQASVALALYGVRHRVIGAPELSRICSQLHLANPDIGRDYISPNAKCAVASVNTIVRRDAENSWFKSVGLWVVDEGHHLQATNTWGRAVGMFRDTARGLAMTATPGRPDGKGLGRNNDGLIDAMVAGPEMATLTRAGYLTPLKIFVPQSDVDYSSVPITASGELSAPRLSAVVHANKQFVGNTVDHYLALAPGKLGVTFCVDVEAAVETAKEYRSRGVPAEVIDAKTPPALRATIMRRFRAREIMQLVNVDILGEGVDVPAVEVVSMARRTASLIVYRQQAGRAVRLMLPVALRGAWDTYTDEQRRAFIASSDKPFGILIDQVGNVGLHGKPDCHVDWSLDRREKRGRGEAPSDVEENRTCLNKDVGRDGTMIPCMFSYSRILGPECPECGFLHTPARRDGPEYVDGHLVELEPGVLEDMTAAVAAVPAPYPEVETFKPDLRMPRVGQVAAMKRHFSQHEAGAAEHVARQLAQAELRAIMATWGGWRAHEGDDVGTTQRRFFHSFGVDVLTAQALGSVEAVALVSKIRAVLTRENIFVDGLVNSD